MINAKIIKNNDVIVTILVEGHSNYSVKGSDIVCSAVSACLIGGLNAIKNVKNYKINIKEGYTKIDLIGEIEEHDQIVLQTIFTQLLSIEASYGDYLKITIE